MEDRRHFLLLCFEMKASMQSALRECFDLFSVACSSYPYGRCRSSVRGASSRVTVLWFPSVNYSLTALVTAFSSHQRSSFFCEASRRDVCFSETQVMSLLDQKHYIQNQELVSCSSQLREKGDTKLLLTLCYGLYLC